jgi:hypothetical protein
LKIGWAAGGEHETGLFGRNQQLMPAPILPYKWLLKGMKNDCLVKEMLCLPHVEKLTLSNAWAPPAALCLFVKKHLDASICSLTLDSISLTSEPSGLSKYLEKGGVWVLTSHPPNSGSLQPTPISYDTTQRLLHLVNPLNAGVRVNPQGFPPAPPPVAPLPLQPIHPGHHGGQAPVHPPAIITPVGGLIRLPPNPAKSNLPGTNVVINDSWKGPHRRYSWPWLLDHISPGATLADFNGGHAYENYVHPQSKLKVLELRSCGYARIKLHSLYQNAIDRPPIPLNQPGYWRTDSLIGKMMLSWGDKGDMLGEISQNLNSWEANALIIVWGCTIGWDDEDAAETATYDGFFKGGTNRFSTVLRRD